MNEQVLLSPPIVIIVFAALASALYALGGRLAPQGEEHPGKRQPYACGEDIVPAEVQLSYEGFFHLALMFAVLHLSALVLSTLPAGTGPQRMAILYLAGVAFSVLVLVWGGL
jgi:NADH:ubiquinone oxidoreductase subunit 3 (subunit A)